MVFQVVKKPKKFAQAPESLDISKHMSSMNGFSLSRRPGWMEELSGLERFFIVSSENLSHKLVITTDRFNINVFLIGL